jgi:hypothetical protein
MKRFLVSIIAVLYLLAGSGLMMHQHYCMGELVDQKLGYLHESEEHACDRCGMRQKKDNGCCESKTSIVKKVHDDQVNDIPVVYKVEIAPAILPEPIAYVLPEAAWTGDEVTINRVTFQKPPPKALPLFLQHRRLLI